MSMSILGTIMWTLGGIAIDSHPALLFRIQNSCCKGPMCSQAGWSSCEKHITIKPFLWNVESIGWDFKKMSDYNVQSSVI